MIVCDICGKKKMTKPYFFPTRTIWYAVENGKKIASFPKYEDKTIDLCETCAQVIADAINHLQSTYQKES
jgi:hypothetical protein